MGYTLGYRTKAERIVGQMPCRNDEFLRMMLSIPSHYLPRTTRLHSPLLTRLSSPNSIPESPSANSLLRHFELRLGGNLRGLRTVLSLNTTLSKRRQKRRNQGVFCPLDLGHQRTHEVISKANPPTSHRPDALASLSTTC